MKKYAVHPSELSAGEPVHDEEVAIYLASEVDARIAQLQHAWQAELMANSKRGDTVSIGMCHPAAGIHALNCRCPPTT